MKELQVGDKALADGRTEEEIIESYLKEHHWIIEDNGIYIKNNLQQVFELGQKAGFESFRSKVEEGVKKEIGSSLNFETYLRKESVLTTIMEIKQ